MNDIAKILAGMSLYQLSEKELEIAEILIREGYLTWDRNTYLQSK